MTPIEQIEALNQRLAKARELFGQGKVHPILNGENLFAVESSTQGSFWLVNGECGCPDALQRTDVHKGWCKHKLAVELFREAQAQPEQPKASGKPKGKPNKANVEDPEVIGAETDATGLYPAA